MQLLISAQTLLLSFLFEYQLCQPSSLHPASIADCHLTLKSFDPYLRISLCRCHSSWQSLDLLNHPHFLLKFLSVTRLNALQVFYERSYWNDNGLKAFIVRITWWIINHFILLLLFRQISIPYSLKKNEEFSERQNTEKICPKSGRLLQTNLSNALYFSF